VGFATRLVAGTLLVLVFALAVLVWTAKRSLRTALEADVARGLEREAVLVAEALPADSTRWPATLRRLAVTGGHTIEVRDRSGRPLAGSETRSATDTLVPADVREAATTGTRAILADRRSAVPRLSVSIPAGPGIVRLSAPLDETDRTLDRAQAAVGGAALLALLVGTVLAWIAARSVAQPLTGLAAAANAIAAGALPRFPRSGIAEIDALVQALRQMHRQLQDRFEQLRREQGETAALVESMMEGVIAADGRGRVVTANAAARRLLGYEVDVAMPALPQLFRAKAAREVVDAVLAGQVIAGRELELGEQVLLVNARPLASGGAVLVLHDQTALRRLETVRRDFVANVSHELKTPLTSISGYAETLLGDPADAATTRRFLEIILNNARRMQRLVDDLLDLSRIEAGRWVPEPELVEVAAIAGEIWAGLADRAAQRAVAFTLDVAPDAATVMVDPDALRQILTNLFDNSLRYTPPGGRITCRAIRTGDGVEIAVADTGSGISGEHLGRIFERFYRADPSRSRDEGGTGLGLSIVKHLAEAHGGRATAESTLGQGTVIRVSFPTEAPVAVTHP
jgi:signal transduction histidine kinase